MNTELQDPNNFREGPPYEIYDYLRENSPVYWQEEANGPGYWALMKYEDVKAVELDDDTFRNAPTTLISDAGAVGDEHHHHLIFSDGEDHTEQREFLAPEVGLQRIRPAREGMAELVDSIIDEIIEKGEGDLVTDLSGKMASYAIADLLGLDREESLEMFYAAATLTRSIPIDHGEGLEAMTILGTHAHKAYTTRIEKHLGDTLSRIAHHEYSWGKVDEFQFALDFQLLVSAGSDTSRNVLSTGMITLLEHPEAKQAILDDPRLLPKALEEILRYTPPIVSMRRTASRDTELSGQKIKAGDKVVMYYGAANRDPSVFENPHTFDISRKINNHMTFGGGKHHCMGAHLARLELTTMFGAMLRRMPDMELAGPVQWQVNNEPPMVAGPTSIPIKFTPGATVTNEKVEPIFA